MTTTTTTTTVLVHADRDGCVILVHTAVVIMVAVVVVRVLMLTPAHRFRLFWRGRLRLVEKQVFDKKKGAAAISKWVPRNLRRQITNSHLLGIKSEGSWKNLRTRNPHFHTVVKNWLTFLLSTLSHTNDFHNQIHQKQFLP